MNVSARRDYSIVGPERANALARGLVDASWYQTDIPSAQLQRLAARRNGPAIRDTLLWFALLIASGVLAHRWWGSWQMVPAFVVYGTLYGSVSDSRWHECGHRTAFRSTWLNDVVYNVASFMVWREPVSWRWSHVRHHSDTIIVGRDPEIAHPRPMALHRPLLECFGLLSNPAETRKVLLNVVGRFTPAELDYLPEFEHRNVVFAARTYVAVWCVVIGAALWLRSFEPLMFVIGPSFYGKWLLVAYGVTQHAGLEEDTLDHRMNTRTLRLNPIHRYLYWNMNFHIEHHMFPNVPYHSLPALHDAVAHDFPPAYSGLWSAYREIWSVYRRQAGDSLSFADRSALVPVGRTIELQDRGAQEPHRELADGWLHVGSPTTIPPNSVFPFTSETNSYLIVRLADGRLCATDGLCTHGRVPLCGGALLGEVIECPKHNGRFEIATGRAVGRPATVDLAVHEVREHDGRIELRPVLRAVAAGNPAND